MPGKEDDISPVRPTLFYRQDRAGCEGWTWTSRNNTELINHCVLYSHLGEYRDFPESIRKRSIRNSVLFPEDKYFEKALFLFVVSSSVEQQSVSAVEWRNVSLAQGRRLDC